MSAWLLGREGHGFSLQQDRDGGYVIAGGIEDWTKSYLLKINEEGEFCWSMTFGGECSEHASFVDVSDTGRYVVAGAVWPPQGHDCAYVTSLAPVVVFRRGEVNGDGAVNIADAISLLAHLFGTPAPELQSRMSVCADAADANDDGAIGIADAITILAHLSARAGSLAAPFHSCGYDETRDELRCTRDERC